MSGSYRYWGIAFALAGTISFAFRPILIKLGYAAHPVSATTLLFLRMTLSLPFFESAAALRCLMFAHLLCPAM